MTDRPADRPLEEDLPGVDRAFELASALHDGEADDPGGADDAVASAARSVDAVARRVAEVPPAPAGLVDDQVAAALAAFDDPVEGAGAGAPAARVTSISDRRPWWQRVPLGAVAAVVAVIALVGAIGAAAVGGDDDADTTATAALESAGDAGDAAGGEAEAFSDAAGGTTATGAERESFAGYDELAAALGDRVAERATTGSDDGDEAAAEAPAAEEVLPPDAAAGTAGGGAAGCDPIGVAGIDPATVELVVPVVVGDQLVTAVVHGADDGRRLTAIDEATCTVADERLL